MSSGVSLVLGPNVPDDVAFYPPLTSTDATEIAQATPFLEAATPGTLMKFTIGKKKHLVVKAMPCPAHSGAWMLQVSQKSLDKLRESKEVGGQLNDVEWATAKYRDLIRYSSEHRWRLISAVLATLSAAGALVNAIFGASFDQGTSTTVISTVVGAAVLVFAKEIYGAIRDFCTS